MDARLLLTQLLKAREIPITVGRMKFILERPTEMEMIRMRGGDGQIEVGLTLVQDKCKGWEGVLESDVVQGGASDPVEWNKQLYMQWIADRPDLWHEMMSAFAKAIVAHTKSLEDVKGN